jgi:hypothetical protein
MMRGPWSPKLARLLCDHEYVLLRDIQHAPISETEPAQHTAFYLLGCLKCRNVVGFPPEHLALVTAEYRAELAGQLQVFDFWL